MSLPPGCWDPSWESWKSRWRELDQEAELSDCSSYFTRAVQDSRQGMVPPTVDGSSHFNEYNQDDQPQTCPETQLSGDSVKLTVNTSH